MDEPDERKAMLSMKRSVIVWYSLKNQGSYACRLFVSCSIVPRRDPWFLTRSACADLESDIEATEP